MSAAWEMVKAGVVRAIRNPVTGGIEVSAGGKVSGRFGVTPLLVIFGDSRADDMSAGEGIDAYSSLSVHAFAEGLAGCNFERVVNTGVGGNKASDLLARSQIDLYDYKPTDCLLMCGHNDVTAIVPVPADTVFSQLVEIFDGCIERGIFVHHLGEYPGVVDTASQKQAKQRINALCSEYWAKRPASGRWYDTSSVVATPSDTTWSPAAGIERDDIHMSARFAYRLAGLLAIGYAERACKGIIYLPVSAYDDPTVSITSKNRLQNPLMTGGSVSTLPTGWSVDNGTASAISTAARADGFGSDLSATFTAQTGAINLKRTVDISKIDPAKKYRLSGVFALATPNNVAGVYCTFSWYDGTNWFSSGISASYSDLGQSDAWSMPMFSPELTFPGITFAELLFGVTATSGQSATATIKAGRVALVEI